MDSVLLSLVHWQGRAISGAGWHKRCTMLSIAANLLNAFQVYLSAKAGDIPARFLESANAAPRERELSPKTLPCLRYLARIVELTGGAEGLLANELAANAHRLHWGQTYTADDFGEAFVDNYGWLEVFGTRGHFANDSAAAGFLILGPNLLYPDHHHVAEEIYIPLIGGTEWRKGEGGFVKRQAGEVIHHPSNISHAMRTGDEPLLALYLWRGGPLAQKSVIGGGDRV